MAGNIFSGAGSGAYQDVRAGVTTFLGKASYLKNLKKNYENLTTEAEELQELRDDIVEKASRVGRTMSITEWITNVETLDKKVKDLRTEYNEGKRKRRRWDHFFSNANFSEDLEKKKQEVSMLLEKGNFYKRVLDHKLPKSVWTKNAPEIDENSSLGVVVRDILDHLMGEKVRRILICGAVGTGKTTIMENLNDNEKILKKFQIVIFETVSKERSIENLQKGIMRRLNLDNQHTVDIESNAQKISGRLGKTECLILLDDVWRTIDLHKVMGIDDNHKHCKVVLASIYKHILKLMETSVLIEVKRLSKADAWNMFRKKLGDIVSNSSIQPTARRIVEECQGLPLLIDIVAKTLKKRPHHFIFWNFVLERLEGWDSDNVEGIAEVLDRLQVCYEDLKDDQKQCFLYGALYPEESMIYVDCLQECWRADGLIPTKFENARDRGHVIVYDLLEVSFLETTEMWKYVKMKKVLRNLALKILLEKGKNYLAKPRERLEEFPDHEECSQASKISLMDNQLQTLPETLACPKLSTLFLQRNEKLVIPPLFFESMCRLRVLDLQGTGIACLPPSISKLDCLRALYLNSCNLLNRLPPEIEALEHLEVLDIRGTQLNLRQIQTLIWLKCLRISLSNYSTEVLDIQGIRINFNPIRIPILLKRLAVSLYNFVMGNHTQEQSGIISSFESLEELSIDVDSSQQLGETVAEKAIYEIANLKKVKLTSLRLYFPGVDCLKFVTESKVWKSCSTFQFSVGYDDSTHSQIFESLHSLWYNSLKLVNGQGKDPAISKVLEKTHAFGLKNHSGVSSLSEFGNENINHMKVCLLEGCKDVVTIISGGRRMTRVLENLENLSVNDMVKLASIWDGLVHDGSLGQLTTLTLIKCPELEKVFSNGIIQQLPQLQHLRVEECHKIKEIIMESENDGLEANALPRLMTLVLLDLPTLKSIWIDNSLNWPSLQKIKISTCSMLKKLPFNMENATRLRSIKGQNSWWEALEWADDGAIKQRLEPLCILN